MMSALWISAIVSLNLGSFETPPVGESVLNIQLLDRRGSVRRLADWRDSRLVVLVFVRDNCPVAELYGDTLARIAAQFESQGVGFLGISPDGPDSESRMDQFSATHAIRFPILRDRDAALAEGVGASRTPEVVVLDERRSIRYRGRIDDRYAVGSRRADARRDDLVEALQELLGGREVSHPETEAVGCTIARRSKPAPLTEVTYSREIAPILQRRCVACHRPGQVGPFSLTSYREVTEWAGPIAEAVEDGRMPPWHASPDHGRFSNDARLTAREKQSIAKWVDAGAPEGNPADLPTPIAFTDGWRIPEPDVVVSMKEDYRVKAEGVIDYQTFEVDPGFKTDQWISAAEIRPGNRKVVHHCNVFLRAPGSRGEVDMPGELESFCLAAMTPGSPPMILPEGMAKRIPAGWRLLFVVHYSPIGKAQVDRTSIGLVLADPSKVKKEVATNLLFDPNLRIPPHASSHRVERSRRFDEDVLLLGMFPHMHLRGKSFRYEAIFPDGRTEILLDVPRYDFRWQNRYELAEPRLLPAGTTLRCVAHFDNSSANPSNPDPSAVVKAGPQSWDEMFNGYYDVALADQDLTQPETWRQRLGTAVRRTSHLEGPAIGVTCAVCVGLCWMRVRRRTILAEG
jgi:peroxiredoxin